MREVRERRAFLGAVGPRAGFGYDKEDGPGGGEVTAGNQRSDPGGRALTAVNEETSLLEAVHPDARTLGAADTLCQEGCVPIRLVQLYGDCLCDRQAELGPRPQAAMFRSAAFDREREGLGM